MTISVLRFTVLLLFCSTLSVAQSAPVDQLLAPRYADMIFYNGPVLTVDDQFSVQEAVAVRDGKILAVGPSDTILRLAGPQTTKVDLEGKKAVIPGVIDTHSHPQRYASSHYWNYIPAEQKELIRADVLVGLKTKDAILARIKEFVDKSGPDRPWIRVNWIVSLEDEKQSDILEPNVDQIFFEMTKEDLDRVSPDRPLTVRRFIYDPGKPRIQAVVNSKAVELFQQKFHNLIRLPNNTGRFASYWFEMLYDEVTPVLPRETLAQLYKREFLEWFAPVGITTVATRLKAFHVRAYALLDMREDLPLRMAYAHEIGRENPFFERDVRRSLGSFQGYGSEMLWMVGVSVPQPDTSIGSGLCSIFPKIRMRPGESPDPYPAGLCKWDQPDSIGRRTAVEASRLGLRIGGTHTAGDKAYEMTLDAVMEGTGGDLAAARELSPVLEHGALANPNLIERAKELNAIWSSRPRVGEERSLKLLEEIYGKEIARMYRPTRTLVEAGVTVTWESGGTGGYDSPDSSRRPMNALEDFVTRPKGETGEVIGTDESVDRKTALRILTRNGAAYVMKEKELGSLEPGKWADLVLLDQNPMDPSIPDDKLSDIQVLMTVAGGKVIYDRATFVPPPIDVRLAKDGMPIIDNETE